MKRFLILFLILFSVGFLQAQPGGGGDPGAGQPVPLPAMALLVAAGAILGVRTLALSRRTKS